MQLAWHRIESGSYVKFQYPRRIEPLVQQLPIPEQAGSLSKFQYPRRIEPLVQHDRKENVIRSFRSFSILVGSSLWCNRGSRPGSHFRGQVSVSSSDRASGATPHQRQAAPRPQSVSVSSSDRASGATAIPPPCGQTGYKFQYPRRIEPLVQRRPALSSPARFRGFSILVGSSLWCNVFRPPTHTSCMFVSVSSSDRASGATCCRSNSWPSTRLFQYPRRIEPLVQR